jgi:hypothetical protein
VGAIWMDRAETTTPPGPLPSQEVYCYECGCYVWPRQRRRALRRQRAILCPSCEYFVCRLFRRLRSV